MLIQAAGIEIDAKATSPAVTMSAPGLMARAHDSPARTRLHAPAFPTCPPIAAGSMAAAVRPFALAGAIIAFRGTKKRTDDITSARMT